MPGLAATRMGARPACDEETIERVYAALATGLHVADAAVLAGISKSAFYKWQGLGREEIASREEGNPPNSDNQRYVNFVDMLTRGEYDAKQTFVERIVEAATPHSAVTRTTKTEARRDDKGRIVYDDDGDPIMVVTLEQVVVREGEWDWKAALELLSRRFHDEWGNRTRTEITGAGGGPLELTVEERTEALVETARVHRQRCAKKPTKKPAKTKAEVAQ